MKKLLLTLLLIAFNFSPALANMDSGLYDPLPPEGSAFIRFLSNRNEAGSVESKINSKGYDYLNYKDITSYYVVPQGKISAKIGDAAADFDLKEKNFYTVVLNADNTLALKTDPANDNPLKSQIVFYNLSNTANLSLKTADGKVEIVPPLPPGEVSEREINPVKVPLALYEGDKKLKDLGTMSLERTKSYTAVALADDDIAWSPSSTNTTR